MISVITLGVSLIAIHAYLNHATSGEYRGDDALVQMRWMDRTAPVQHYRDSLPPVEGQDYGLARLDIIQGRGSVRVGYLADALPFAFSNEQGVVVGFDIEMAHGLANDLGVKLELVRVPREEIDTLLSSGHIDVVMSGLAVTAQRALRWEFAASPIDLTRISD